MKEQASFSKFGTSFQEGLCQLIFEDRPFADQIMEVLDINFLELEYLRVFVNKLFRYRTKYNLDSRQSNTLKKLNKIAYTTLSILKILRLIFVENRSLKKQCCALLGY